MTDIYRQPLRTAYVAGVGKNKKEFVQNFGTRISYKKSTLMSIRIRKISWRYVAYEDAWDSVLCRRGDFGISGAGPCHSSGG